MRHEVINTGCGLHFRFCVNATPGIETGPGRIRARSPFLMGQKGRKNPLRGGAVFPCAVDLGVGHSPTLPRWFLFSGPAPHRDAGRGVPVSCRPLGGRGGFGGVLFHHRAVGPLARWVLQACMGLRGCGLRVRFVMNALVETVKKKERAERRPGPRPRG